MVTSKLTAIWKVLTSKTFHIFYQKYPGTEVQSLGEGQGTLKDMMLLAVEFKKVYNGFVDTINNAAVEGGELHALKELKEALEKL